MNEKFSQFTVRAALDGTEIFPLAIAGVDNYQITTPEIVAAILGYGFTGSPIPQLNLGDGTGQFQASGDGAGNWLLQSTAGQLFIEDASASQLYFDNAGNINFNPSSGVFFTGNFTATIPNFSAYTVNLDGGNSQFSIVNSDGSATILQIVDALNSFTAQVGFNSGVFGAGIFTFYNNTLGAEMLTLDLNDNSALLNGGLKTQEGDIFWPHTVAGNLVWTNSP